MILYLMIMMMEGRGGYDASINPSHVPTEQISLYVASSQICIKTHPARAPREIAVPFYSGNDPPRISDPHIDTDYWKLSEPLSLLAHGPLAPIRQVPSPG
ncbi:hypothetical protein QCA50_017369 [Cerrena zonata]|uniref:Uncharacterized protein n=1 Tax=Cerrena zonata TaxID=2478898 RepID=A0AAW0FHC4_9APHY